MIITAPASTANIGPGFDALALALSLDFSLALNEQPKGGAWEPATQAHPSVSAYRKADGVTPLEKIWTQSNIPYARGLGFSAAARVTGAYAALLQNGMTEHDARDHAFRIAGDIEGHDDNAAASTYGGLCVTTSGHVMRFDSNPEAQGLQLVLFIPELTSSTEKSRESITETFTKAELVQSVGNVAMLVAMLASNTFNDEVLAITTNDVIHQPVRFEGCLPSKKAYETFLEAGAVASWLSGAGSSVAALVADENVADVISTVEKLELDCAFSCRAIPVEQRGVRETTPE